MPEIPAYGSTDTDRGSYMVFWYQVVVGTLPNRLRAQLGDFLSEIATLRSE